MQYASFAIWWVPRPGTALGRFGAAWTGWCADRGIVSASPTLGDWGPPREGVPGSIGRFGLHATIKSPFRLAPGRSSWALESALADLAERTEAIRLPPFELTVFDGRVVLVSSRPDDAVARLTEEVAGAVRRFHVPPPYRPHEEIRGAGPRGRDESARAMPPVERLHLPLTDRLALGTAYEVVAELEPRLAPVLARGQSLDDVALVGDPGGGRPWRVLQRMALAGDPAQAGGRMPDGMAFRGPSLLAPFSGAPARDRAIA